MSKRSQTSLDVKLHIVERCIQNQSNPNYEAKQLGIAHITVRDWIRKYRAEGVEGLKESSGWKEYPDELKLASNKDVLSGNLSIWESTKKYQISSSRVLRKWISKYTCGKEINPTRKGNVHKLRLRKPFLSILSSSTTVGGHIPQTVISRHSCILRRYR
ncbi:transposase [Paenibacillus sp. 2TAB23]|uniref:transposase n=1 Tax=Paenibacillus sp. 2TAB23 TaxID=3233004 RepID=UPI003F9836AC